MTDSSLPCPPQVSVIVTTFNEEEGIADCLESLVRQATQAAYEIIVIDSSTDQTPAIVQANFPQVTFRHFAERKFCGDARNIGLTLAQGTIVAFTDGDCIVSPDWIDSILLAHQAAHLIIGGSIAAGPRQNWVGWAAYFAEFSHWLPGNPRRSVNDVAGANMSFKREAFTKYGPFLEGTYGSDTDFHWRSQQAGQSPFFEPAIKVRHNSINHWRNYLAHEIYHGWNFGVVRIYNRKFGLAQRLLYTIFGWLIPVKIFGMVLFNNVRNPIYFAQFIRALPPLVAGISCWSLGEVLSYAGLKRRTFR